MKLISVLINQLQATLYKNLQFNFMHFPKESEKQKD